MLQLIEWLEKASMRNIYIIDNVSTYPPLWDYYRKSKHVIFKLDKNVGHMALWKTHIFMWFKDVPYVYTDPDILPVEECPLNSVEYFRQVLQKYPEVGKVGFGLKIDDIPDHYQLKDKVVKWEKQFWEKPLGNKLYEGMIDTTFALYRPNSFGDAGMLKAIRTGGKYMARHLPWYIHPKSLSEEDLYYFEHSNTVSSWFAELKGNHSKYS